VAEGRVTVAAGRCVIEGASVPGGAFIVPAERA